MAGQKITLTNGKLNVPDNPIIPFIEGDGTGVDIWKSSVAVIDAAVNKAYGGKKKIEWLEVLAGEKAFKLKNDWLPDLRRKLLLNLFPISVTHCDCAFQ